MHNGNPKGGRGHSLTGGILFSLREKGNENDEQVCSVLFIMLENVGIRGKKYYLLARGPT